MTFKRTLLLNLLLTACCGAVFAQNSDSTLPVKDTRYINIMPGGYNRNFSVHLKWSDSIRLPRSGPGYAALMGIRAWIDDTGGKAHELAFTDNSNIYFRSGYSAGGWNNWQRLLIEDANGKTILGKGDATMAAEVRGFMTLEAGGDPVVYLGTGAQEQNRYLCLINSTGFTSASGLKTGGLLVADSYNYATPGKNNLVVKGNMAIGTTDTKGYKLAVAGDMIAERVRVKAQSSWPDYVFDSAYHLPSLQEVENHIKANGCLPAIPPAAVVMKEGIDVAEMNKQLLQKVEELTLYLIEMQKRMEKLENAIKVSSVQSH